MDDMTFLDMICTVDGFYVVITSPNVEGDMLIHISDMSVSYDQVLEPRKPSYPSYASLVGSSALQ